MSMYNLELQSNLINPLLSHLVVFSFSTQTYFTYLNVDTSEFVLKDMSGL